MRCKSRAVEEERGRLGFCTFHVLLTQYEIEIAGLDHRAHKRPLRPSPDTPPKLRTRSPSPLARLGLRIYSITTSTSLLYLSGLS